MPTAIDVIVSTNNAYTMPMNGARMIKNNPIMINAVKLVILKYAAKPTITKKAKPTKISTDPARLFINMFQRSNGFVNDIFVFYSS